MRQLRIGNSLPPLLQCWLNIESQLWTGDLLSTRLVQLALFRWRSYRYRGESAPKLDLLALC